jgi:hypothetical protein
MIDVQAGHEELVMVKILIKSNISELLFWGRGETL